MASDAVQAHAESYIGLVEAGVGVVPAWGGCKELLSRYARDPRRPKGPMPPVAAAFETIGLAKVAKSAFEAKELGRSEEHTSELQSLMRNSYAVFCLKKKKNLHNIIQTT